jgi:hypothetical protein
MRNIILCVLFTSAGIGLGAVNVWNNAMAINGGSFRLNDLTMLVAALAVTGALLAVASPALFGRSVIVGLLAMATVIGCTTTSLHYTIHRVGGVSDAGAAEALAHNIRIDRAVIKVRTLATAEQAECATGIGPQCRDLRKKLDAAEAGLAALGAPRVVDPSAERISRAAFGLITPGQYRTVRPLITAASLELGCNLLLVVAGLFAPSGSSRRQRGSVIEATAVDITPCPVTEALQLSGAASNRELAQRLGWSESKTSRAVATLRRAGAVTTKQHGRQKLIALA